MKRSFLSGLLFRIDSRCRGIRIFGFTFSIVLSPNCVGPILRLLLEILSCRSLLPLSECTSLFTSLFVRSATLLTLFVPHTIEIFGQFYYFFT